jgi:hypothetical protein
MTNNEYLKAVLQSQDLADDSAELKALTARRKDVEALLRNAFPDSSPTIRYGGSRAKGTLIKESYDLDIVCYFPHDDTTAGETLEDIYNNVAAALEKDYSVERKRSALRLRDKDMVDFHIDVVPGRFTDDSETDCFLYQENGEKCRLKTNLQVHIDTVRDSGVLDAIRLLKLWKVRKALDVKQFVFELLIIDLLSGHKNKSLTDQLIHVWTEFRDVDSPPKLEDPANPCGNDLTPPLDAVWNELGSVASSTLSTIDNNGWEGVFGKVEKGADKSAAVQVAVTSVAAHTRPWCQ